MKKERYTIFLETLGVPPNLFTADFTVCHRYRANVILYLRSVLCWTSEEGVGFLFLCLFEVILGLESMFMFYMSSLS